MMASTTTGRSRAEQMSATKTDTVSYLDNTGDDPTVRARLVVGDNDFHSVTEKV